MYKIFALSFLSLILVGCGATTPVQNTEPSVPSTTENSGTTVNPPSQETSSGVGDTNTPSQSPLVVRGTEPFWSFIQTSTGGTYSFLNETGMVQYEYTSVETNSGGTIVIHANPVSTGEIIDLELTPGACSDGMSEMTYSYSVSGTYGTGILTGCAIQ